MAGDVAGKANGRVFGGVFLEIGRFVSLVDNDKTEVFQRCKEGRAGADDDLGMSGV